MDAIELLEQQHEEVTQMLNELKESSPGSERNETFKMLQHSLLAHMSSKRNCSTPSSRAAQRKASRSLRGTRSTQGHACRCHAAHGR